MSDNGSRPSGEEFILNGVTLKIKRISPLLVNDIRKSVKRKFSRPEPPLQDVDYGDGKKVKEPNPAHPDYKAALSDYNAETGEEFIHALIRLGVECEVDEYAVKALREIADDLALPDDDKVLYISRILVASPKDLQTLQDAILGRIQPTEAAIAEKVDSFPG